ncbi:MULTISPECIES: ClbS/DfsB family four-helix bundle protein [Paenibacillus]|uniref:ClbS/DfsB family four-helix bundle protein n=1 Tax=Paenibacillus TaxID=44249 RepID=UPI0011EAA25E|nr:MULTISPECIES: ClbS/DfsB family four-helix bundle protein [Paenibacillus]MBE0337327.1 ClbS/DfsB family four-helix bundle protein [Paenibacillus sp. 23TSA30-6]
MPSYHYASKTELKEAIHASYLLLDSEYKEVDENQKDVRIPEVDKTPAEIIAYQLGWLHLVMSWDRDEKEGKDVIMPAPNYKWNRLGELYQSFYKTYTHHSLHELRQLFKLTEQKWLDWIDTLSHEELFTQGVHKWTGSNPKWPMARWIHINSVAPFKTFRAKIRKWKKYNALH